MPKMTIEDAKKIIRARIISRVSPAALQEITEEKLHELAKFALKMGIPKNKLD